MLRERRAGVCHHVFYAVLVHGDDVGVAFNHEHVVLLGDCPLCLIESIELVVFVVDVGLGRVDVFLLHSLGA